MIFYLLLLRLVLRSTNGPHCSLLIIFVMVAGKIPQSLVLIDVGMSQIIPIGKL